MPPTPDLVDLPTELIETIAGHLDLNDICSLRLASRAIAAKAFYGPFQIRFSSKSFEVSQTDLRRFEAVTRPGCLGCAIEHLTLVGNVAAADTEPHNTQDCKESLIKALSQLRAHSRSDRLRSIRLSVKGPIDPNHFSYTYKWRGYWKCAGDMAHVVMQAVEASGIKCQTLDLYGSTANCALSPSRLQSLSATLETSELKSLSLAVSASEGDEEVRDQVTDLYIILSGLIARSQRLEHLELRCVALQAHASHTERQNQRCFTKVVATLSLSFLTSVYLKGLHTTSNDLLNFLTNHPQIRHLCLEWILLAQGHFDAVFEYVTTNLELESLYFNDLWQPALIYFPDAPGESHFPQPDMVTWIKREKLGTREKIVYKPLTRRIKGSAKASNWRNWRQSMYGPPG